MRPSFCAHPASQARRERCALLPASAWTFSKNRIVDYSTFPAIEIRNLTRKIYFAKTVDSAGFSVDFARNKVQNHDRPASSTFGSGDQNTSF
jgi:hypothetical protein